MINKRRFEFVFLLVIVLVGSAFGAFAQQEVLSSFCQFQLTENQRQANRTFTQGFRVSINKDGRVNEVKRILGKEEWVATDRAEDCFAQWKFRGFDEGRTFVVYFSWEHGVGWTQMIISGGGYSQITRIGNSDPCPGND